MKKAILILGLLAIAVLMISCGKSETTTGAVVDVEKDEMITQRHEVTVRDSASDDWCQAGSDWKMTAGDDSASWKVKELVASGKYKGLCHVVYTMNAGGEKTTMDYYFDEDGKNGYVEIKLPNGQTSVQEWHG